MEVSIKAKEAKETRISKEKRLISISPEASELLQQLEDKRGLSFPSGGVEFLIRNFAPLLLDDHWEAQLAKIIRDTPAAQTGPVFIEDWGIDEIKQDLRNLKRGAYKIPGSIVASINTKLWPYAWVEESGEQAVGALATLHKKHQELQIKTQWKFCVPKNFVGEAVARLDINFIEPKEQDLKLSIWFDIAHHQIILDYICQTRCLIVASEKPNPSDILAVPKIGLLFDELEDLEFILAQYSKLMENKQM